jgi:cytochrome c oxidase assembly protein subunit 15
MQLRPVTYRRITIGALLALCAIVVTGAAVRLTGSGLGCDDWPNCNNEKLIDVSTSHAAIEQVNRLFTGVVAVSVIAAVLGSLIRTPRRRDLTWWSLGLVAGVVAQIVLGGITVLTDLHPLSVQGHFLLSMVIVANAVILVRRAGEPDGVPRVDVVAPTTRRLVWGLFVMTSIAVVTGTIVTGTGPHAGDEDARRFGFEISDVARVHGITVIVTILLALAVVARVRTRPDERAALSHGLTNWLFVAVLQAVVGYAQYFTGVPVLLVAIHIAGATALYCMTTALVLDLRQCLPPEGAARLESSANVSAPEPSTVAPGGGAARAAGVPAAGIGSARPGG